MTALPEYLRPDDVAFCVVHAIEEAGEFLAAAGKTLRFGPNSFDPTVPVADRETNIDWLWREMADLRDALDRLEVAADRHWPGAGR